MPLVIIQIFDRVIPNNGYATLAVLLAFLLAAALGEAMLRAASAAVAARAAARFEIDAADRLAYLTLFKRRKASEPHDPVETLAHFDTIERLRAISASEARQSRFTLPFAAVFGTAFALIAPGLVWVLCLAVVVVMLAQSGLRSMDKVNQELSERAKRSAAFVNEAFDCLETIKGLHAEPFLARRHEALALGAANAREKTTLAKGTRRALTETAAGSVPVLMATAGAYAVVNNQMTAGALAAAILLSGRIIQPLLRAQAAREARFALRPAEESLARFLAQPAPALAAAIPGSLETLRAKDLSVFCSEGRVLLDNVSLDVSAGETVAITGPSGGGKSILLQALTGRLLPDWGDVFWNRNRIGDCDPRLLGRHMQLLKQHARLPDSTALELMTAGSPERLQDVLRICSELGMQKSFAEHPSGMNARLVQSGSHHLPTAVIRRLHIVRALALRPDIIIFDEANSGLDAEADGLLREYFVAHKGEFALILVSERPSYLRIADRVLTMREGRLEQFSEPDAIAQKARSA
ncbi:ATP-binding cassette domain-containing protein [Leisingera aquaemixtae]|uniref:ATP-binding cassette domain-containing protein n=1 Tax=Leisingera aquaemixtae TaxID=1396826 RepID=UPI001C989223|nr:ATP-binding cassette domain-containing protein [Leisingera aquaemixtae]